MCRPCTVQEHQLELLAGVRLPRVLTQAHRVVRGGGKLFGAGGQCLRCAVCRVGSEGGGTDEVEDRRRQQRHCRRVLGGDHGQSREQLLLVLVLPLGRPLRKVLKH